MAGELREQKTSKEVKVVREKKDIIPLVMVAFFGVVMLVIAFAAKSSPAPTVPAPAGQAGQVQTEQVIKHGKPNNKTPIGAAQMWVEAMVKADSKLMNRVNRSEWWQYPTEMLMQDAHDHGWTKLDLRKFEYRLDDKRDNVVVVTHPDKNWETKLKILLIDNRYYFVGYAY